MKPRTVFYAACMGLAADASSGGTGPPAAAGPAGRPGVAITAGSFNFPGSDRAFQPAENITPVVGRDVVARYGTRPLTLINAVSARPATGSLRSLDAQVVLDGRRPRSVAGDWLRAHGLMPAGGGAR